MKAEDVASLGIAGIVIGMIIHFPLVAYVSAVITAIAFWFEIQ